MAKTKKKNTTKTKRVDPVDRKAGEFTPNDVKRLLKAVEATTNSIGTIEMRLKGGTTTWASGARAGEDRKIKSQKDLIDEAKGLVVKREARLIILQDRLKALKALLAKLKKALTRAGSKQSGPKSLAKLLPIMDEVEKVAKVLGIAC